MAEQMVIFTRTYDFLSWLLPLAENFPKSQRFVVTSRLQGAVLNFQERIIEANTLRGANRLEKLKAADAELLKARLYLRMCSRWRWMSKGQYYHASTLVSEIGKLLGGWLKSTS